MFLSIIDGIYAVFALIGIFSVLTFIAWVFGWFDEKEEPFYNQTENRFAETLEYVGEHPALPPSIITDLEYEETDAERIARVRRRMAQPETLTVDATPVEVLRRLEDRRRTESDHTLEIIL